MKKLLLSLAVVVGMMSTYAVTAPQVDTASAKTSSYQEKMDYYNKQIAILQKKIDELKRARIRIPKGSEAYRASLRKEISYLKQMKYYYNLIIELNS